jgi:hypothetical protein
LRGEKGINPKATYGSKPSVRLTKRAAEFLSSQLNQKFAELGRIRM